MNGAFDGSRALLLDRGGVQELTIASSNATGSTSAHGISADGFAAIAFDVDSNGIQSGGTYWGNRVARLSPGSTSAQPLAQPAGSTGPGQYAEVSVDAFAPGGVFAGTTTYRPGDADRGYRGVVWDTAGAPSLRLPPTVRTDGYGVAVLSAVNASGGVAGSVKHYSAQTSEVTEVAARWAPGTSVGVELAQPASTIPDGTAAPFPLAMNNAGTVVGFVEFDDGDQLIDERPVRWDGSGTAVTVLGTLGTRASGIIDVAQISEINNAGTSVAIVSKYNASHSYLGERVVRYDATATVAVELGTLPTSTFGVSDVASRAHINALGTIGAALYSTNFAGSGHAVIWLPGASVPTDLNTLAPASSTTTLSTVNDVSDTGWIAGMASYDPDGAGGVAALTRPFTMLVPQAGTYGRGDANFDTSVNFADLVILAQHYNQSNAAQNVNVADFNLDGTTNFADLVALAQHYNTSAASIASLGNASFAADWALAQSLVPEPRVLPAAAVAMTAMLRRRLNRMCS